MDGIKNILDRIDQEIQQDIAAMHQEAQEQAAAREVHYDTLIAQQTEDILARGREEAIQHEERLVSVAMVDCRKATLAARQTLVSQAFDQALNHLVNLPEEEYIPLVAQLTASAAITGSEAVIFSEKDRARYGKAVVARANELLPKELAGNLTLSPETRDMEGGVILSDGQVELNCSFETLIRLQRGTLDLAVAQVLFPQS